MRQLLQGVWSDDDDYQEEEGEGAGEWLVVWRREKLNQEEAEEQEEDTKCLTMRNSSC